MNSGLVATIVTSCESVLGETVKAPRAATAHNATAKIMDFVDFKMFFFINFHSFFRLFARQLCKKNTQNPMSLNVKKQG